MKKTVSVKSLVTLSSRTKDMNIRDQKSEVIKTYVGVLLKDYYFKISGHNTNQNITARFF